MAVMCTRRAITAPTVPPMATPPTISPSVSASSAWVAASVPKVTAMAMAMPIMPSWLPRRLVTGLERPLSARMKRTPATT